jgi:hypothetical protein
MVKLSGLSNGRYDLKITDVSGRIISAMRLSAANGTARAAVPHLKQGVYFLTLYRDGNTQKSVLPVIK